MEEHIVAAAERLQDEIAKMPRQSARKFARALCLKRNMKATVQDELQKLVRLLQMKVMNNHKLHKHLQKLLKKKKQMLLPKRKYVPKQRQN